MEVWDLVDESRNPLGKLHTRGDEINRGEFHIVVEIFTFNADGRILLTQRGSLKSYPLLWESIGGSVNAGESSLDGAIRELEEETGIVANRADLRYLGEMKKGNYYLDSYLYVSTRNIEVSELILQPGEVCDAKWVTFTELKEMNRRRLIVPTLWQRYQLYFKELENSLY